MPLKVIRIEVTGLLGTFKHVFDFPASWDFCILYGPNGIGKTKLLEIIQATLSSDLLKLSQIPFQRATLSFSDGSSLTIDKVDESRELDIPVIKLSLQRSGRKLFTWPSQAEYLTADKRLVRVMRDYNIVRVRGDQWRDLDTDEFFTTTELIARHSDVIPNFPQSPPDELVEFLKDADVHLIETQRLLHRASPPRVLPGVRRPRPPSPFADRNATVLNYAEDLAHRLQAAMTENSRASQKLDRSFPRRVLNTSSQYISDERIRERFDKQNELREQLSRIALLDSTADHLPLPDRPLEDWERSFLWIYLDDAEKKLATFRPLLEKVRLLQDIVNARFLFKRMEIDRNVGFRFVTDTGNEISAASLSSGEQHELVLVYNLLFKVRPQSLVLIDEPEISLHVVWQHNFLSDIQRISQVSKLRFIVATHSPQIIHHWRTRAIPLGPFANPEGWEE